MSAVPIRLSIGNFLFGTEDILGGFGFEMMMMVWRKELRVPNKV